MSRVWELSLTRFDWRAPRCALVTDRASRSQDRNCPLKEKTPTRWSLGQSMQVRINDRNITIPTHHTPKEIQRKSVMAQTGKNAHRFDRAASWEKDERRRPGRNKKPLTGPRPVKNILDLKGVKGLLTGPLSRTTREGPSLGNRQTQSMATDTKVPGVGSSWFSCK